ncbi:MAG: CPBP family intramembrane glutamic endopeptidase [Longimicrobiales bacterium]
MTPGPGVGLLDAAVLAVLLGALPVGTLLQARLLDAEMVGRMERLPVYASSIAMLVGVAALAAFPALRSGGAAALGLSPVPDLLSVVLWTAGLTAASLAVMLVARRIGAAVGAREHPIVRRLLPRTAAERRVFAVLSLAAGVGEEIAYRGYAILVLVPMLGGVGALVLTSVVFGLLHAYQGVLGIVRTAVVGGVLGAGLLLSGSLWPCVAAHTLLDLVAGLGPGERLMVPEPDSGVGRTTPPMDEMTRQND